MSLARVSLSFVALSILLAGCGDPPAGYWIGDVSITFEWDDRDIDIVNRPEEWASIVRNEDRSIDIWTDLSELRLCEPFTFEETVVIDGAIQLDMVSRPTCTWTAEAGGTVTVTFVSGLGSWRNDRLIYQLFADVVWDRPSGVREGRVSFRMLESRHVD
jgi:hypothetical protein